VGEKSVAQRIRRGVAAMGCSVRVYGHAGALGDQD